MSGFYIHIPYCLKKCYYCDFFSVTKGNFTPYIQALVRDIKKTDFEDVTSVYIGGGTPTILDAKNLDALLCAVSEKVNPLEFTIEANPKTVTAEKLSLLKNYGVNRISIGMQSTQDRLLNIIGRCHTHRDFLETVDLAKKYDFEINADAMFNLPSQTMEEWIESINTLINLDIPHVSCYSLTIAENTPFGKSLPYPLPKEDTERLMYKMAVDMLSAAGLKKYEVSNFAKEGHSCKHNMCYWKGEDYYAFGASSHGFLKGKRFYYEEDIEKYILGNPPVTEEVLSRKDRISEYCMLSLRLTEGISCTEFKSKFNQDIYTIFKDSINTHIKNGLLQKKGDSISLTDKGFDIANYVMEDFIL